MLQEVSQALGDRQHPLAHRLAGEHLLDQMRRGLHHAPGIAGGAHATAFAGKGDQEVVAALRAARPGKARGEDPTFQIAPELALHETRHCSAGWSRVRKSRRSRASTSGTARSNKRPNTACCSRPRGRGTPRSSRRSVPCTATNCRRSTRKTSRRPSRLMRPGSWPIAARQNDCAAPARRVLSAAHRR